VALGKVDYIEVVGFSDHKSTLRLVQAAELRFRCRRLQEQTSWATTRRCADRWAEPRICGGEPGPLKIEPWAGVDQSGPNICDEWAAAAILAGWAGDWRGSAAREKTGGALFSRASSPSFRSITCRSFATARWPGIALESTRTSAHVDGSIAIEASGWCVLRAFSDKAEYPILDIYLTQPPARVCKRGGIRSAQCGRCSLFVAWVDRLIAAASGNTAWNTEAEKRSVLSMLQAAREKYAKMAE